MRILYLADIRFPLERANGIQSMATCHALAARGHEVTLVVRPDTRAAAGPIRLLRVAGTRRLRIEVAPVAGPSAARRAGYVTFAIGRATGHTRQDLIFTRDLGLASLLLRIPRRLRAPVVYEAHGIAAGRAAALPDLFTARPGGIAGETAAARAVARRACGSAPTVTSRSPPASQTSSGSASARGRDRGRPRRNTHRRRRRGRILVPRDPRGSAAAFHVGYAGHLYPWKGVDS